MLDIVQVDPTWGTLEEDGTAVLDQWKGGEQDHERDAHADPGVSIVTGLIMCEPDNKCGNDNSNVVEGIANDVNEDTHHAEISARRLELSNVVAMLRVVVQGLRLG